MNRKQFLWVNGLSSVPYSNRLPNQQARSRARARGPFQLKRPHLINWLCVSMATTLIPWVNQLAWKSIPWWFAYKENLQQHVLMPPIITICSKVRRPRIAASPQRGYKTQIRGSDYLLIFFIWQIQFESVFGLIFLSEMWQMFKEDMFLSKAHELWNHSLSSPCSVLECVCNSCGSLFSHRQSDVPLKPVSGDTVISYSTYHKPALTSLKSTLSNHTQRCIKWRVWWEWNNNWLIIE